MMYLLIIPFLVVVWFLNKKSTNNYFKYTPKNIMCRDFVLIKSIYGSFGIDFNSFENAWRYFTEKPNEYNGTSVINDRWLIKGLEPLSVEHDYDWIIAKSLNELHKSNLKYCNNLRKINTNWIWVWGFIYLGLTFVSIFKSIKFIKY